MNNQAQPNNEADQLLCRICGKPVSAIEHILYSKKRPTVTETHFTCFADDCRAVIAIPGEKAETVKKYQEGTNKPESVEAKILKRIKADLEQTYKLCNEFKLDKALFLMGQINHIDDIEKKLKGE